MDSIMGDNRTYSVIPDGAYHETSPTTQSIGTMMGPILGLMMGPILGLGLMMGPILGLMMGPIERDLFKNTTNYTTLPRSPSPLWLSERFCAAVGQNNNQIVLWQGTYSIKPLVIIRVKKYFLKHTIFTEWVKCILVFKCVLARFEFVCVKKSAPVESDLFYASSISAGYCVVFLAKIFWILNWNI